MFISYRSTEEAKIQAKEDKELILAMRKGGSFDTILINKSTNKITPTYKDYLDQIVIEVNASCWKINQVESSKCQVLLFWEESSAPKLKVA